MSIAWLRADWPAPEGVVAGTTLRAGGRSAGRYASLNLGSHVGDDSRAVARNRELFRDSCKLPAEPRWLRQVHGTAVASDTSSTEPEADALSTDLPGVVCAVLTADCLPVVLAARSGPSIAVAHAGWRGLADGILEQTVAAMACDACELQAWLGPAISQKAFEVGADVRQRFVEQDAGAAADFRPNARGRWQADLYGLARRRLAGCGVTDVYGGGRCTYGEPLQFFSYRRDGVCGRMATFAFRQAEIA